MDLRSVLALAQQQRSIPGLLSMLRGGDVQGGGGGRAAPQPGGGGGDTPQLQMAQSAMGGDGGQQGPAVSQASDMHPASQAWLDLYQPGLSASALDPSEAWRIEPGAYVRGNQIISPDKFYQDTHRPVDTQEGAGIVGGSLLPYRGSNIGNAWSTKGQLGYFGQTGPWSTQWGAGGP